MLPVPRLTAGARERSGWEGLGGVRDCWRGCCGLDTPSERMAREVGERCLFSGCGLTTGVAGGVM